MKYIKAHCPVVDKWFSLELDCRKAVNFVDLQRADADAMTTEVEDTFVQSADNLRPCCVCGSRTAGRCNHIQKLGLCDAPYFFQCLYCQQLRISLKAADVYTRWKGVSNIPGVDKDRFGNPKGSQFDLARDGGFDGELIVILMLFDDLELALFDGLVGALRRKGFKVDVRQNTMGLARALEKACQLWVISFYLEVLSEEEITTIEEFYKSGRGLYIFGDNEPFYVDANRVSRRLFGTQMHGNLVGDKVIGVSAGPGKAGIIKDHPITTGIVSFYEGITIATVDANRQVKPLIYGSAGNLVAGYVDENNCRALVDGGYTRLYHKWDTAGTDRYIVNAATYLANVERFGSGAEKPFTDR